MECKKCRRDLPETAEYFPRDKRNRNGLRGKCRQCTSMEDYARYERRRDAGLTRVPPKTTKQCKGCKKVFPLNDAYFQKHSGRFWRTMCRVCYKAYCKDYRERNRDDRNAKQRAYEQRKKLERYQQIIKG